VRTEFLPFHVPDIGDAEIASVEQTLRSGWLTTGPKVKAFEQQFAEFVGARHAVAVNSCTAALHLALDAIGLREGDEVLVPTLTFAATAEVVFYCKANPVLIDCCPQTLNLDVNRLERAITARTRAIVPVHFAGQPCDMDRILDIARRHNIAVIEDAAHALPAWYDDRMVGTISDMTCFSFYATKTITTGEGGMVTTNNDEFADRMRIMSLHGINKDAWKRYTSEGSWRYDILQPGFKYNLTDIAAALGIEQLKKCVPFYQKRKQMARVFDEAFADLDAIQVPYAHNSGEHAWHLYVIQLNLDRLTINRDRFLEELKKAKVGASVHFIPLHLHPFYRDKLQYDASQYPCANKVFERIISLPLYTKMTPQDQQDVIDAVRDIVKRHQR
jgi:dTDP-4-amino-4,6-dideoxygalactose transaminase